MDTEAVLHPEEIMETPIPMVSLKTSRVGACPELQEPR